MKANNSFFFEKKVLLIAVKEAFFMMGPLTQWKNPVMFVTYIGALITTGCVIFEMSATEASWFDIQVSLWLWFTILFSNFAGALAESRGKAQAESLRKVKIEMYARKIEDGVEHKVPVRSLQKGDVIFAIAGDTIAADGEIIQGIATIDESAITGESAPVIRESGGDRSFVTAGTKVLSDSITIRVTSEAGHSFLDRMIALIEGASRQKTPNEIALNIVLSGLTIVFLLTCSSLKFFADYSSSQAHQDLSSIVTVPVLVSLLVCLIPTTISALINAVGIAGMDRLVRRNVIAKSGRSVEAAGDIDLLLMDKTGTITLGNRRAIEFMPVERSFEKELAECAQLASLSDETPEGRSIVVLAKKKFNLRAVDLNPANAKFIPFSAVTKVSGIDLLDPDGHITRRIRKGAPSEIRKHIERLGGTYPTHIDATIQRIAKSGSTPLLVSDNEKVLGVIELKDIIKGGIKERFQALRKMGIRTIMITGDNPLTAAAVAAEVGVDDYIAEATPEIKLRYIKKEQEAGHLVAMTGDGTNDAPALAQADVAVAMNTGTVASREAGNMVDLDSNPSKLIDIVIIGKQLLMTRGALTTFSIANDVAKYFAILPALFGSLYLINPELKGPLSVLNIMCLHSPHSAILSAVIFNALIIVMLIPLALKGVQYKAQSANDLLRKNVLLYGLGGIIAPFLGIKVIDMIIGCYL